MLMNLEQTLKLVAFSLAKLFTLGTSAGNLNMNIFPVHRSDDTANFPVAEPNWFACLCMIKKFGHRDSNLRRRGNFTLIVADSRFARLRGASDDERVTRFQQQSLACAGTEPTQPFHCFALA